MRLLVVIVNYRTASLTIDCLRSLRDEVSSIPGARVIVTDNASGDRSVDDIAAAIATNQWSGWVQLLPLDHNGGFAYGNNSAIRPMLQSADPPDYVLLLNPDTLVREGALRELLKFMDEHSTVGIAGSRLENPDTTPQRSAFRFPGICSEIESGLRIGIVSRLLAQRVVAPPAPREQCPTNWVAGASMIIRKAVLDSIGLLDESYFMYFEEVDFCLRARDAGWACWYVPQSRVVHLVGQSSGVTDTKRANHRRPSYWFDSRRRFFLTHYGRARTLLADSLWAAGFSLWRIRRALFRLPDPDPDRLLGDFLRYNFCPRTRVRS